jgi:hypothetical protein
MYFKNSVTSALLMYLYVDITPSSIPGHSEIS